MPHVDVDGLALNVDRYGMGPPVVLLHGFTGSRETWKPLVRVLDSEFTTLSVDLVGHGLSGSPAAIDRYRMDRAADDLAALLHRLGFDHATWLGYSFGGRVALQVAARHPEVVDALVLEGASPGLANPEERAARVRSDETLADRIESEGLDWFVDYWGSLPLWDSQRTTLSPAAHAALREQRLAQRATGLANSLRGMGTGAQTPVHDRLAGLSVPVLLVTGTLDLKFTQIAQEMARTLPDATIRQIEGAGHAAHLERPDELHTAVIDFLRRVHAH